jgi:hypothetical protein
MAHTHGSLEITVEWLRMGNVRDPSAGSDIRLRLRRDPSDLFAWIRKHRSTPYGDSPGAIRLDGDHGSQTIRLEAVGSKTPSAEADIDVVLSWWESMGSGEKFVSWTILQRNSD